MSPLAYRASPTKRNRRTKAEMGRLKSDLWRIIKGQHPMTVRQVFYQAVSRGLIAKSENEYNTSIVRLLTQMRRDGTLPFGWIADNTRWMRKPSTYTSLRSMLRRTRETYRRALWDDQAVYVEIWLEKDALAGVVFDVTSEWDVPLMVTRGYPSISFLHDAAEGIGAEGKPAFLYYLGDHDPSGHDITRATESGLREFAPDAEIHFERIAVTENQIQIHSLPTRPTKPTDSRSRNFIGGSVEVDAIPPEILRTLVRSYIEQHVDQDQLERTRLVEQQEIETLHRIERTIGMLPGAHSPS